MKENKETKSSAHSKNRCQYHIVFARNSNVLLNFQCPFQGLSQYSPFIGVVHTTGEPVVMI